MIPFERIYFDSDMLLAGGWPRGKADLESALSYARELKLPVFIPEPVELELEEGWLRKIRDHQRAIAGSVQAISGECKEIAEPPQAPAFENLDTLRPKYGERVKAFKATWDLQTSPFTDVPLKTIHEMSVRRRFPSEDKKDRKSKHFQDVVIFLSIIDHLRQAQGARIAAFVAGDGIFDDDRMVALAKEAGVSILTYKSLKEIANVLEDGLRSEVKVRIEQDRSLARAALSLMLDDVKRHIVSNVRFSKRGLFNPVLEVKDVENLAIGDVVLPPDAGEKPFEFFFEATLELVAIVEQFTSLASSLLKVGETPIQPTPSEVIAAFNNPVTTRVKIPKTVVISAKGSMGNNQFKVLELGFAYEKGMSGLAAWNPQDVLAEALANSRDAQTNAL